MPTADPERRVSLHTLIRCEAPRVRAYADAADVPVVAVTIVVTELAVSA